MPLALGTLSETASGTSFLSGLDESGLFGPGHTAVAALGSFVVIQDAAGNRRRCLDFMTAYGAVNFGHRNPVIEVAPSQVDIVGSLYPPEAGLLAEWLCRSLALAEHEVLFQIGGSFAVSTALAIAHGARPGRPLAMEHSFHGLGVDALAVTGVQQDRALQRTTWASLPEDAVARLRPGDPAPSWEGISSFIFEPIQGANGYVPIDPAWLVGIVTSAQEAGVVVIADEIQSGYYRHGHLSVARSLGIEPDIVLFSKSLTNGAYPLSAVVYRSLLVAPDQRGIRLSHTFQTGAAGYAAGLQVARYLESEPIAAHCERTHGQLASAAAGLRASGAVDCYVAGPSLSFGTGSAQTASALVRACFDRGLLVFTGGNAADRIRVAPPVNIDPKDLADGLEVLLDEWKKCSG